VQHDIAATRIDPFSNNFPSLQIVPEAGNYCLIPESWFQRWLAFIQRGSGHSDLSSDIGGTLLCTHKKLLVAPWPAGSQSAYLGQPELIGQLHCGVGEIRLLRVGVFESLYRLYPVLGRPIEVTFSRKVQAGNSAPHSTPLVSWDQVSATTNPGICHLCAPQRMLDLLSFEDGTFTLSPSPASLSSSSSSSTTSRRKKKAVSGDYVLENIRSSFSIMDFKMAMMSLDQLDVASVHHIFLSFNGNGLADVNKSLLDYGIPSGSIILYEIDKSNNPEDCDEDIGNHQPERGFKNSNLF
jgi:hypothetical protein